MRFRTLLPAWSLLVVGAMSFQTSPAVAQVVGYGPRPERPDRGLFRSGLESASDRVEVNGSAGAGWDNNVLLDLPGNTDPRNATGVTGVIYNGSGGLSYSRARQHGSFSVSEASSARFYPGQTIDHIVGHSANIGGGYAFSDRTTLSASQSISYQPFTFTSLFPTSFDPALQMLPAEAPSLELAANKAQYLQYTSAAAFNRNLTRRTSFNASYHFDQSDTAYSTGKFTNQGAAAGFRFSLTRNLGLRLGYGYQEGSYGGASKPIRYHNLDVGLDYSRALSFSRRTTLSFGTGTSIVTDGNSSHYQASGSAQLNHEIGRTWRATITYDRSFQFVSTLLQPVFYDAASAGLGGLVNRRIRVQATARASIGSIGVGSRRGGNQDFDTYQGLASVSFALSRFVDFGVSYSAYRYRFGTGVLLPTGVARDIDRQSVSAHVDVWAPLYGRARRNNATR